MLVVYEVRQLLWIRFLQHVEAHRVASQRFAGGPDAEGKGWVPNITQKGLGDWSSKDIAYFLETGQTPDGDNAGGLMAKVIKNTSQLSEQDRDAIAEYVKSLPPVQGPKRPPKKK